MPGRRSVLRRQREDVEEEFECPVCQETDKELRIFPVCQHFACTDCVGRLIATAQQQRVDRQGFDCPNCRADIEVPAGGLPIHRMVEHIREIHQRQEQDLEQIYADVNEVRLQPVEQRPQPVEQRRQPVEQQPRRAVPPPAPQERVVEEADNNAVNAAEELRRKQVEQACNNLVKNDDRCDGQCHKSCLDCGPEMIKLAHFAFCEPGGRQCNNRPERSFMEPKSIFLLPCWVYTLMMLSKPCIEVFRHESLIRNERKVYKPMRDKAWEIMLSRQTMTVPYWFQVLWSVWLILMFAACVGISILEIIGNPNLLMPRITCCLNGGCLVMWIIFTMINVTLYKPSNQYEVKGESLRFSYFYMQQIQQFLSELSVYPQLCISCLLIQTNYNTVSALPFYVCCSTLLMVFALRFHTAVSIRRYIRVFFVRLLLFIIGCTVVVFFWLAALIMCSGLNTRNLQFTAMLPAQILLSVFIFCNNTINMAMFYISHLYEVTLQSGITIMKLDPRQFHQRQQEITELTQDNQSFYKNMYPMGSACYGTLLFFWLFPVGAVIIACFISALFFIQIYFDDLLVLLIVLGVASLANFIVNAKTLLLSCSGYFTCCVLLGLLFVCGMASAFFVFIIYAPIVFVGALMCICYCACASLAASSDND